MAVSLGSGRGFVMRSSTVRAWRFLAEGCHQKATSILWQGRLSKFPLLQRQVSGGLPLWSSTATNFIDSVALSNKIRGRYPREGVSSNPMGWCVSLRRRRSERIAIEANKKRGFLLLSFLSESLPLKDPNLLSFERSSLFFYPKKEATFK